MHQTTRRGLLKTLPAGAALWSKPAVQAVLLPAHAQLTAPPHPAPRPADPSLFITIWRIAAANESITIPTAANNGGGYDYTVDWGDGSAGAAHTGDAKHTYAAPGDYEVRISGAFPRVYFNNRGDKDKLVDVKQWGNVAWTSMERAFYGCANLELSAADSPDLSRVSSLAYMFRGCVRLHAPRLADWHVGSVMNMRYMFAEAAAFNQALGTWEVGAVTDMRYMFAGARAFNQDLGSWDVRSVTNMRWMFSGAHAFNQDLGSWDVSAVTDMDYMFVLASAFNQDIGSWDVSAVRTMVSMFLGATLSTANYDALLSGWSVIAAGESALQRGVKFHAGGSRYSSAAQAARDTLTGAPNNWTITDGGRQ